MKTPSFWFPGHPEKTQILPLLLKPLSILFYMGGLLKRGLAAPYNSPIPVICVGNAIAGGAGKTPTAIKLAHLVKDSGIAQNPCFLTRGYKGKKSGPLIVDTQEHTYKDVGDEPLLLAGHIPTIVSKSRQSGAKLAVKKGYDLIIMDDGFQNTSLTKDIHVMVVDARGFGNGQIIPSGPLREPLSDALRRADLFIATDTLDEHTARQIKQTGKPLIKGIYKTSNAPMHTSYLAFAGLANPLKFKVTLENNTYALSSFVPFPDHHAYSSNDLKTLETAAAETGATLITTEKDFVRLPQSFKEKVQTLPITLDLENTDQLIDILRNKIKALGKRV